MYGHNVIEDLKKHKMNFTFFNADKIDNIIDRIKNAQHFHFSPVEDIVETLHIQPGSSLFLDDQAKFINPPYKQCWFDLDTNTNDRISKIGYLFYQPDPSWVVALYFEKIKEHKQWFPVPFSYFIGLGKTTMDISVEKLQEITNIKHLKYRIASNITASSHMRVYQKELTDKDFDLAKEGAQQLASLNFCLMLLNCINIYSNTNKPPEKLNKKRRKKKKQEFFSYKTLSISLPREANQISSKNITQTDDTRLHLCRGHFKIYTEQKPLFGKITGRYFWQPQIRGNKKMGIVTKDYETEINKNV